MRRRAAESRATPGALALVLLCGSVPLLAETGATVEIGVSAEYRQDERKSGRSTLEREALRTILYLALAGEVIDPRFLIYEINAMKGLSETEEASGAQSDSDDLSYDARVRAFANRLFSLTLSAGRTESDFRRAGTTAVAGGVSEARRVILEVQPNKYGSLSLAYGHSSFDPTAEALLRRKEERSAEVRGEASIGRVQASLDLRRQRSDSFGGQVLQDYDGGFLDLAVNRGGTWSWHSGLGVTRLSSLFADADGARESSTLSSRNALRRRFRETGYWRLAADWQLNEFSGRELTASRFGADLLHPLTPTLSLKSDIGMLLAEGANGNEVTQHDASLGFRWSRPLASWEFVLAPRLSYTELRNEGVNESSLGGAAAFSLRRPIHTGWLTLDGEYAGTRLSIETPDVATAPLAGRRLRGGLERERRRLRLVAERMISKRVDLRAEVEARYREVLSAGRELGEDQARARLSARWGRFQAGTTLSRNQVEGGEFPVTVEIRQAELGWSPWPFLALQGRVLDELRETPLARGEFSFADLGLQFQYARLSFYLRFREEEFEDTGAAMRKNRRVWAGIERTLGLRLGNPSR